MKKKFFLLSAILIFISCRSETFRAYGPVERSDVQVLRGRTGIIRTSYCNICIQNIDISLLGHLADYSCFRGKGDGLPSNPCFSIMISNTWNRPFQVTRVEIISGGKSIKPDFFGFIKKSGYSSARYRIDLEKFWKTRRVLTDAIMVEEIDFDYDTVQYDLGFIAPDDEVIFFRTFEWIPAESEKTRIRIGIKYYEMEKVIDFDVADFEYYESETDELETLPEVILKNENR